MRDGGAVYETPWQPVGDVAGREREQRQRKELGEADQAQVERALVDGVHLPPDCDGQHLSREARRENRPPVEREVPLLEHWWQPPSPHSNQPTGARDLRDGVGCET